LGRLQLTPGTGPQAGAHLLNWEAIPGAVYHVQRATNLSGGGWRTLEPYVSESPRAQLQIQGRSIPENSVEFFRLLARPELSGVEPGFVDASDPEAVLYLLGQWLPSEAVVLINGQKFTPTLINSNGVWASVSLKGLAPDVPIRGSLAVLDAVTGEVVATWPVQSPILYGTAPTLEQLQGPPGEPPASPISAKGKKLYVGNLPFAADSALEADSHTGNGGVLDLTGLMKAKEKGNRTKCSSNLRLASGELVQSETDLAVPGRGLDFVWVRTYRSRTGLDTAQGRGWDFSYNVSLTQQPDGTVQVGSGNGRCDTFYPNGTNGWSRDEYFVHVIDLNKDGMPDMLFADGGKWLFHPSGSIAPGKLWQIVDRNGNRLELQYDSQGRCERLIDTLNRTNTIAYTKDGFIDSVTDFSGRTVRYEYDASGDLVACISPTVTGTPNGNDFPGGKTNRYTYSQGFHDERLNHNLQACMDAKGQTWLQIIYQTNTDPASVDFDAVASVQRGIDKKDIWRGKMGAQPAPAGESVKAIVRDALGNVTEYSFDSRQRCVRQREYTGRSNPKLPVTETDNRPKGKLRPEDPDYFEQRWEWNPDSLCTRVVRPHPNIVQGVGLVTRLVYERDFDANANPRKKGDLRVAREIAWGSGADTDGDGAPDIMERAWRFEYDSRFGSPALDCRNPWRGTFSSGTGWASD
ncbi:MAG TPA: DUF6531 domain-containing protein, partial [Candidatus Sulfotelmatobacter sp.]|nr:DUF6531 domain-containing protein [Candidatus Sulfotelmatobacter sp.]